MFSSIGFKSELTAAVIVFLTGLLNIGAGNRMELPRGGDSPARVLEGPEFPKLPSGTGNSGGADPESGSHSVSGKPYETPKTADPATNESDLSPKVS